MTVSRLQMIAVTAKNISFDGDLTIAVLQQVLVYNCKRLFVMWPESNQVGLMAVRCRNILLARDIKICLGFSAGALKNATKI